MQNPTAPLGRRSPGRVWPIRAGVCTSSSSSSSSPQRFNPNPSVSPSPALSPTPTPQSTPPQPPRAPAKPSLPPRPQILMYFQSGPTRVSAPDTARGFCRAQLLPHPNSCSVKPTEKSAGHEIKPFFLLPHRNWGLCTRKILSFQIGFAGMMEKLREKKLPWRQILHRGEETAPK